jgi:diguanylate cyclase (GGDEF)-like protein
MGRSGHNQAEISALWGARLCAALSILLGCSAALANGLHQPMRFEHLSRDEGLSHRNVLSIFQDSDGLMWFGTENGLNRYNGYEFKQFRRDRGNPLALRSGVIHDLAEDPQGDLWIATDGGGAGRLDRNTGQVTSYRHTPGDSNSIAGNAVRTLLTDADGAVWLGVRGAGLDRFDRRTESFTHYRFGAGSAQAATVNEIHALYRDSGGSLWVGTDGGLGRLDIESGEFELFVHDAADESSISGNSIRSVLEDSDGYLWVGTDGAGLNRFDRDTGQVLRFRHDAGDVATISGNHISAIFEDSDSRLWLGTTRCLNLLDRATGQFARYVHSSVDPSSLGEDTVTQIFEDRSGILWIGTRYRGLSKWNPRSWHYGFDPARRITGVDNRQPNITSFALDSSGVLWVGTFGDGLNAIDRESGDIKRYRHDSAADGSLSDDRVMSLELGDEDNLWVGTVNGGLNRLDLVTGEIEVFRYDAGNPASLSSNSITALFRDSRGLIWIGTFDRGISRFNPGTGVFRSWQADASDPTSLSSNRVTSFAEDPSGRMWIGTDGGGLNLYDPETGRYLHFRHDAEDMQALAADTVYALNIDATGTVWVGTQGGGLDKVVGSADAPESIHFRNVSEADGLTSDVIYGIEIDRAGNLWLSSNYGISRYDPDTGEIVNLHRGDGLQSEEFNFGAHYQSDSGEIFFGGPEGFNAFDPDVLSGAGFTPPIVLTGVFLEGDSVTSDIPLDTQGGIGISHRDGLISFEFAALDYAAPSLNRYMYKLEGADNEWHDLGVNRRVSFADLDDGHYVLHVKAASSDGVWNDEGMSLPIDIAPAHWDTWWAYLGYVFTFAALVVSLWSFHQRRIRNEEAYSQLLEEEVCRRTEELARRNNKLRRMNQELQESSLSDPLTGLRNRRFVFEEISRDLEVVRRKYREERRGLKTEHAADMVFMMIDLDNFKPINDTYGHAAGDAILIDVRNILLGACRNSDYVIRWGGDEFVVIARQAHPGEAEKLAERIRRAISQRNFRLEDGQIVRTTCSIGFAAYPLYRGQASAGTLEQVINMADNLMYEAKQSRNAWAGMLGVSDAATSVGFDVASIAPNSMLFRAKRDGSLREFQHGGDSDAGRPELRSAV